jgi:hypothetical protein
MHPRTPHTKKERYVIPAPQAIEHFRRSVEARFLDYEPTHRRQQAKMHNLPNRSGFDVHSLHTHKHFLDFRPF